ncbi:lipooligosaccharide transport system permease protein [Crossiella equi]|uniref:Transport permease protein n=1 Tax=Crossiella equi TaxID=130796 RepID=A0ABS5AC54_9PSEU|nr:ABC transporter permease [Crossiella equi]MBP2474165.1 lipooligosaccharide transport system permease protein [Crossiella equi]
MTTTPTAPRPGGPLLRVLPSGLYAGRGRMLVERALVVNRRSWLTLLSGLLEPLFFLLSLGVGFGSMVGQVAGPDGAPMDYAVFLAPALLASAAMNGAINDATYNVFFKLKYAKLYDAVLATSLGPLDVAVGEITWAVIRGGLYSAGFLLVMLGMDLIESPWALLALPAALFVAFAFAAAGMACTTFMRSWQDFDLIQLAILPMFLFCSTFYPLTVYPRPLQWIIEWLPLYRAVELMRGLTTGHVGPAMFGHLAYFLVIAALGLWLTTRRLGKLLLH